MTIAILEDRRFIAAALLVLAVYAVTLAISPLRVFWTPDEGAKWLEMQSVRVGDGLEYHVDFPAQRIDTAFHYLPHHGLFPRPSIGPDGDLYLAFETPVVFPLLSGVGFWLFGVVGIYLLPLLSGWLMAVVAGVLAAAVRPVLAAPATLVVGLATPVWFYSVLFWEHTAASCLGILGLAVACAAGPWSLAGLLAALLFSLAAATLRLEMLAFAAALVLAWVIGGFVMRAGAAVSPRRRPSAVAAAASIGLLIVAIGAAAFLRASLTVRHNKLVETLPERLQTGIETLLQSPWSIFDVFVHTSISESLVVSDTWVLAGGIGIVLCIAAACVRRWEGLLLVPGLALVLVFSLTLLFAGETYRALHGFVPVAPFVVVAPFAWSARGGQGDNYALVLMALTAALACVVSILGISTIYIEIGRLAVGIEWGQRYLLTVYVIAAVLAVVAVHSHWHSARPLWLRRFFSAAVALMMLTAVAFEVRGNGMLYRTRVRMTAWEDAMLQEGPLVTDVWWLPASFAVLYTEREMYYVYRRRDVAGWLEKAAPHGIRGFTFVAFSPADAGELATGRIRPAGTQPKSVDGLVLTRFVVDDTAAVPAQPAE